MEDFYKPTQKARMFLHTMTSQLLSLTMQNDNEWAEKCFILLIVVHFNDRNPVFWIQATRWDKIAPV